VVLAVALLGLLLAACSSSSPGPQAQATAAACSVFSRHAETKQIETAATEGQRSGDSDLRREAAQLQRDLASANQTGDGLPWSLDVLNMANRCGKLGFHIAQGW
jgi:hypothetical protein